MNKKNIFGLITSIILFIYLLPNINATIIMLNYTSNTSWEVPSGVTRITVETWGAGGGGGGAQNTNSHVGAGGAGGQYVLSNLTVVPTTNYNIYIGAGGTGGATGTGGNPGLSGGDTVFGNNVVVAKGGGGGGGGGLSSTGATGSTTGAIGNVSYRGGSGSNGASANSGAGGGGAGTTGNGGDAAGLTEGSGTSEMGGSGGAGRSSNGAGNPASTTGYGGAGGGGRRGGAGGDGRQGYLRITYETNDPPVWSVNLADTPDPVTIESSITYTGTGTDPQTNQYRMTVCSSDSITNGYPGICTGTTLCTSSAANSGNEASCQYATQAADEGTLTAYAFLCDSGSSTCTSSTSTTTTVSPAYGTLSVVIDYPSDNYQMTRYESFRFNATVSCTGSASTTCGTVSAYARYNNSGSTADTSISTSQGATPLFLVSGTNPQTNAMSGGDTWKVSFIINGTSADVRKELDVLTTSSSGSSNVPDADSSDITIAINDLPPSVTTPLLGPSLLRVNQNAIVNTTYTDTENDLGTIYFKWYVNGALVYTTTNSSVTSGTLVKASLYQGNYTVGDKLNVSVYASDGDNISSTLWSTTLNISAQGVSYSNYDGATTDFDNLPDTQNVDRPVIEKTGTGMISWKGTGLNVSGVDFDSYVTISANNITVDSANINPDLNGPANLTLSGLNFQYSPVLYRNGVLCGSLCRFISYSSGVLKFNVSGFSSYTSGANSKMEIWDETDSGKAYAGYTRFNNDNIFFFANYTNITSGIPIQGGGASCTINFGSGWLSMVYNSTRLIYQYNRSFASSGNYNYNISCDGTSLNYEELNTTDDVTVQDVNNYKFWNGSYVATGGVGQWNISSAAIASWFFGYILNDGRNFTLQSPNAAPYVILINLTPTNPNTSTNINCNATVLDADQTTLTVEYWWYNNSVFKHGGNKTGVANNTNTVINTLGNGNTTKGEIWNCTIRVYDGALYSNYNSTRITIGNTPPTKPTLLIPTNGNTTIHNRQPTFNWTATDADNDPLNYTINITFSSALDCGPGISINISSANYTPSYDFCTDWIIYWKVRAYDGTDYSEWSDVWNFTIESFLSLNLTTDEVDFGVMNMLDEQDTDLLDNAFILENTGNILINVSRISANASLFERVGLNTQYFQFKADNTTEMPSFNWTTSTTSWENLTDVSILNKTIITKLDYNDSHDTAQIDIRIQVPLDEPSGSKKASIYIVGGQS